MVYWVLGGDASMKAPDRYILSLDQGTTTSRAIVFNSAGNIMGLAQQPFKQIYPQPGWVEHDPEEIWETQLDSARKAIEAAQISIDQIESIGITNQRETTILWDATDGKPVYNAIVWQCRRSADICRELEALGMADLIREKTGLILDAYFSATKLLWLFQELPELKAKAERGILRFGTVDSWLLYKLTGVHRTDATNASRTMLFNIRTGVWDKDLLSMLKIPASILPEVFPSSGLLGETKRELFGRAIPVTGCAGDQQAALFGHACFHPGDIKNTYGTGCFTLMNTGKIPISSKNRLLTTIAWRLGTETTYALEGSVFIGGAIIQWLRDEVGLLTDSSESERLARSVDDTGGAVIVPAFVGLGAPYWDPDARGAMFGLSRGTTRAHLARAALESIAYQTRDLITAMEADYGKPIGDVKADGGAAANSFLMQFQADILGKKIALPEVNEITALGAAYLAGLATGYWESEREISLNWRARRIFEPQSSQNERLERVSRWLQAVSAARSFKP